MTVPGLCLADEENGHQVTRFSGVAPPGKPLGELARFGGA